jgi:hypothetical protein
MKKYLAPGALILAITVSLVLGVLKPVPHGHRYDLAFQLTVALALIWLLGKVPLEWIFKRGVLAAVFVAGLGWGIFNVSSIDPRSEIVDHYRSVFEAIDSGRNPYTSGTIFHRGEDGDPVYGNFNYPPAEIYPYYLAYRLAGRWDSTVLTGVMILINGLACLILLRTFPHVGAFRLAAFFPLFLVGEIKTTPSLTVLVTAILLGLIVKEMKKPGRSRPYVIAVVFGIGLMTKFLILPLMAAYYVNKFRPKEPASLVPIVGGGAVAAATAALIMAPFGIMAVLKNTFLFNLVLEDRSVLATFYPNILSGPLIALGLGMIYPLAGAAAVALAVLAAPRLSLFAAMLTAAFVFLLAAPTPEPQYLPIVLYLTLASRFLELEKGAQAGPVMAAAPKLIQPG